MTCGHDDSTINIVMGIIIIIIIMRVVGWGVVGGWDAEADERAAAAAVWITAGRPITPGRDGYQLGSSFSALFYRLEQQWRAAESSGNSARWTLVDRHHTATLAAQAESAAVHPETLRVHDRRRTATSTEEGRQQRSFTQVESEEEW